METILNKLKEMAYAISLTTDRTFLWWAGGNFSTRQGNLISPLYLPDIVSSVSVFIEFS